MTILILCETSGVVREAFRKQGHTAVSCDLMPADDGSPLHIQGDMRQAVSFMLELGKLDMIGAHPPCTYLCGSGIHWNNRGRGWDKTNKALEDIKWLMSFDIPWYIENPIGIISTHFRKPNQTKPSSPMSLARMPVKKPAFGLTNFQTSSAQNASLVDLWNTQKAQERLLNGGQIKLTADRTNFHHHQHAGKNGVKPIRELPMQWPANGELEPIYSNEQRRR